MTEITNGPTSITTRKYYVPPAHACHLQLPLNGDLIEGDLPLEYGETEYLGRWPLIDLKKCSASKKNM
jgi:hypothetical protein